MNRLRRSATHTTRTARTATATVATVIGGALALGAAPPALGAPPAPGPSVRQQAGPVAVINGDLSQPALTGTSDAATPTGWSVGSTVGAGTPSGVGRYAGTASGHPAGRVAVMLRRTPGSTDADTATYYSFKQRLRGVRPGARVTVTFDDSPGTDTSCTPAMVAQGQTYTVRGAGGQPLPVTTRSDPNKQLNQPGTGAWTQQRSYTFTADAYEPLLTFTSTTAGGLYSCGPLIANIAASQVPPPLDRTVPQKRLPASQAFLGNDSRSVSDAVAQCNSSPNACTFTEDPDYSFSYYEPARQNGDIYLNCTREKLQRTRPISFSSRTLSDLPASAGIPPAGTGAPTNVNQQLTTGLGVTPAWSPETARQVTEVVNPDEVSWLETQAGRKRTEGWFKSNPTPADPNNDWRLYTVIDTPASGLADRVYQRTGPLTDAEYARCRSNRPSAPTPNNAGDPAGSTDRARLR
ncbi:hypothetical protein ACFWIB_01960 [Streptomyces sp. NPDC127051]|uniref:hypothetical protein n=1 Tax=Streptomyces sp. NPDC127051 TaxID=3347119 RepID=UPI00365DFDFF